MRRNRKLALGGVVGVAVFSGLFLFAPVMYWNSYPDAFFGSGGCTGTIPCMYQSHAIYRSLGCETLGIGDLYSSAWGSGYQGLRLGCAFIPRIYT